LRSLQAALNNSQQSYSRWEGCTGNGEYYVSFDVTLSTRYCNAF
jgi:hypothetical protein